MKKLFSILLAMAMLFSVSIVPALAASTTCEIIVEYANALVPGEANTMTLTINVDDDTDKIMAPYIIFNATGFDSIEMTGASDFLEAERAFVLQDYGYELQGYNGTGYPDGTSFTFSVIPNSADASIEFDVESSAVSTTTADVYLDTITVKVPESEEPEVTLSVVADDTVMESAIGAIGEDETDYEYGAALGLHFQVAGDDTDKPTLFNKMIWAITIDGARKYSEAKALNNVSGDFKVAATFVNGNKVDGSKDITAVGAILKDTNDGVWFTNEDIDGGNAK